LLGCYGGVVGVCLVQYLPYWIGYPEGHVLKGETSKRNDRNETAETTETTETKRPKRNNRNDRNEMTETKRPKI
jgi:hypothetical protein